MPYSLHVEQIDKHGMPLGTAEVHRAPTEQEAMALMNREIGFAMTIGRAAQFNVFGPDRRLLVSYTSGTDYSRAAEAHGFPLADPLEPITA